MELTYKVFSAVLIDKEGKELNEPKIKFCCSNVREVTLRREIEQGRFLMKIKELLHETTDRNEARNMATEF